MLVADLIGKMNYYGFTDKVAKSRVIALDAKDSKILFDTGKNKQEYIDKFMSGRIIHLLSDVVHLGNSETIVHIDPVIKIYVSHDSWKRGE